MCRSFVSRLLCDIYSGLRADGSTCQRLDGTESSRSRPEGDAVGASGRKAPGPAQRMSAKAANGEATINIRFAGSRMSAP